MTVSPVFHRVKPAFEHLTDKVDRYLKQNQLFEALTVIRDR